MKKKPEILSTTPKALRPYDSNPFTLIFGAFGRFFQTNMWWGIGLIVISFLSFGWQTAPQFSTISVPSESSTQSRSDSLEGNFKWLETITPEQVLVFSLIALLVIFFIAVLSLLFFALYTYVYGMFAYVALQSEKGKSATFEEAFSAVNKRFWRLFLAQGLASIKIFLWTLLLIVPGIIAALRYALLTYVIMDQPETEKGVITSHNRTKQIVKGKLMEVFGMLVASGIIPFIGDIFRVSGSAAQYNQLAYTYDHKIARPQTHLLNYLGFLLILLWIFMFVFFVGFLFFVFYISAQAA